jgi:hypothetical protein
MVGREHHPAFEHQPVSMYGDRQPGEEAFECVEL